MSTSLRPSQAVPQPMRSPVLPGGATYPDPQQNLILGVLNSMITAQQTGLQSVPTNPLPTPRPSIGGHAPASIPAAIPGPALGVIEDQHRRREDYPDVPYWTRAEWNIVAKNKAPTPGQRRARGSTLVAQGINRTLAWITHADGTAIDGHEVTEIRSRVRAYFVYLYNDNRAPDTWHHGADARIKADLENYLRAHAEVFQYCDKNWKCQKIATDTYAQWYAKFKKRLARKAAKEASATLEGKKRARECSLEYLDVEDEQDADKAAGVASFLTGAKYVIAPPDLDVTMPPVKRHCNDDALAAVPDLAATEATAEDIAATAPSPPLSEEHRVAVLQLPNILGDFHLGIADDAANITTPVIAAPPTTPPFALSPPSLAACAAVTATTPPTNPDTKIEGLWPPHVQSLKLKDKCATQWLFENPGGTKDACDLWYKGMLRHAVRVKWLKTAMAKKDAATANAATSGSGTATG
ncbi:hypothetical protein C2E23DRAFT_889004 [Lenzites betulinus]|nr:hypothetical protein C2E23DRAFT_889004 [Lenzites betulinus]